MSAAVEGQQHEGEDTPERRARIEARKQEALEAMPRGFAHTVTVEAVGDWDRERLAELRDVLDARPDLLGQVECVGVRRRVIGVTVTVKARNEKAAQEIATVAIIDEMVKLGLI